MMDKVLLLLRLAKKGAMEHFINLTTKDLGEELGMSQQSASLYLMKLEEDQLIERIQKRSGSRIRITKEGIDILVTLYNELKPFFEPGRNIEVTGKLSRGLGEGAYYLSQEGYIQQIQKKFSLDPYPGTLNITLSENDSPLIELLRKGPGIVIEGFRSGERTFGSCLCYRCKVNGEDGVIMVPNRTLHQNTVEIVSPEKLREKLHLKDDDSVSLEIEYPMKE
jgi:riboflavin kinase